MNNKLIQRATGLVNGTSVSSSTLKQSSSLLSSPIVSFVNRIQPSSTLSSSLSTSSSLLSTGKFLSNFEQRRFRSTLDIEIDMQKLYGVDLFREPKKKKKNNQKKKKQKVFFYSHQSELIFEF